jgi:hypothetical protein
MKEFSTTTQPQTTERALTLIKRQPAAPLDFAQAIIVNREQLTEAHREARHVSGILHNIENLDDLSWDELNDLCRMAYRAAQLLSAMLDRKAGDAR